MPRTAPALLAALVVAAGALPAFADGADAEPFFSRLARKGWILEGAVRTFGPDTLYEEVDGEAEMYLPYGFRDLRAAIVVRREERGVQAGIELFRHATAKDAFGVYSQRRFPGQETAAVGPSEAIVSDASVDFFRGDVFVRIRQASPGAGRPALLGLAREVSEILGGTGSPPPDALLLSIPSLGAEPAVYHKRAVLGYEGLAPGYEAGFRTGNLSGRLVLVEGREGATPEGILEALSKTLPRFTALGGGLFRADPPAGTLFLVAAGGRVAGAAAAWSREEAEPVLAELRRILSDGGGRGR